MKSLLIFFVIFFLSVNSYARDESTYALWEIDGNQYIYGYNDRAIRPIASMTKLMTALIIVKFNLPLDETLIVRGKETSSRIRAGMKITRLELLKLALISSDNLAARTLAETFPYGYDAFIEEMNVTAKSLNMQNTKFTDPTGLLSTNVSTTEDMKNLVLVLENWKVFQLAGNVTEFSGTAVTTTKTKQREIDFYGKNTNKFAGELDIIAAKTGTTTAAGRCLTMFFIKNEKRYLLVIMGARDGEHRKNLVNKLLSYIS